MENEKNDTSKFDSHADRTVNSPVLSDGKSEWEENSHHEEASRGIFDFDERQTISGKFENPLAGVSKVKLFQEAEKFCRDYDLMENLQIMKKGALVAQSPLHFHEIEDCQMRISLYWSARSRIDGTSPGCSTD
jgi:hypothetical protein